MSREPSIDYQAFYKELHQLRDQLRCDSSDEDFHHLLKVERWGRLCTIVGYATAWIIPNPISILAISQGIFTRWAMVAHHICHRGYDRLPNIPKHYTSKGFAKGWRRFLDWFDLMIPEAWNFEHNVLHHYRLGEEADPDQPERNTEFLRQSPLTKLVRLMLVFFLMSTWKWLYYAPNTIKEVHNAKLRRKKLVHARRLTIFSKEVWLPFSDPGRELWRRSWLPYFLWFFVVLPALLLPISSWAAMSLLINRLLAEMVTNIYSFLMIVSNHAGDDLYRFDCPTKARDDFYLRQIIGSVNYSCGSDWKDFLHGWLNYQIEHHLWPDMSMRQYQRAQPKVKALCDKYGIPYIQEPVWRRARKTIAILIGSTSMRWWQEDTLEALMHP